MLALEEETRGALPPICTVLPNEEAQLSLSLSRLLFSLPLHYTCPSTGALFRFIFVRVMYSQLDRADFSSKSETKKTLERV